MQQIRLLACGLVIVVMAGTLSAQRSGGPPPAATGVVGGRVTAADTGQPLRRAQIRLAGTASTVARTATTDGDGRFMFADVAAGDYTVSATKPAYLDMVFGARKPGLTAAGTPVRVAAGQKIENLELRLPRGGVISGVITDEYGDPAFNTSVRVMRYVFSNGERYATPAGQGAFTDDRGAYRIAGLAPGEYVVSAVPRDGVAEVGARNAMLRDRLTQAVAQSKAAGNDWPLNMRRDALDNLGPPDPRGYVPVHYPGTVLASAAAPVRVEAGGEASGIDIRLQVVHTATVTGTVTWAEGAVPAGARVQLVDPTMPMPTVGTWWTGLTPGAKFTFYGIPPGAYLARVSTSSAGSDLFAIDEVHADSQRANNVDLRLQRGMSLSGTVLHQGAAIPLARLRIVLQPVSMVADAERGAERVGVDPATGRFTLRGLLPGLYRFQIEGLPAGWSLASAMFGDRDAADLLIEMEPGRNLTGGVLRFTSQTAEVAGAVANAAGQPVVNAAVVVFPEDRRLWVPQSRRIHVAKISSEGRYVVRGLPPGDYRVALADPEPGEQHDVEFLAQLIAQATPVSLSEGEKKTQDLRPR